MRKAIKYEKDQPYTGKPFEKKTKTPEQALSSLMRLCSRAEKSSGDALRLMRNWGVDEKAMRGVLDTLIKNKFIDDHRYAEAYTREKTNLNGWGGYKIKLHLRQKGINTEIIEDVIGKLDKKEMNSKLKGLLQKKKERTKAADKYDMKTKLLRYGSGLGYGYDEVTNAIEDIISSME